MGEGPSARVIQRWPLPIPRHKPLTIGQRPSVFTSVAMPVRITNYTCIAPALCIVEENM